MKKLILYDHTGLKLLEQDVFVEGQNFAWESPKPTAFWLGEIWLVDREPESKPKAEVAIAPVALQEGLTLKEEKVELKEVDNQDTGDSRVGEASEPESLERLPEKPTGGEPSKRGKRARKRKAA